MVPTSIKFGKTFADWRQRIAIAEEDAGYSAVQHVAALRSLLVKAHGGSPFYRNMIDDAFGVGRDLLTIFPEDLRHLPVVTKQILADTGDAVLTVPRGQVDIALTSGSNGEPGFAFYLDKDRSPREMAFIYNVWSRIGFHEKDARASLRGFSLENSNRILDWDPALKELKLAVFPLTADDATQYLDEIDERRIRYLYGYPSAIELFCRRLEQIGRTPRLPIKGIMPISEPLYTHQRMLIRNTLGDVQFAPFYGLSEKAAFAAEIDGASGVYEFDPLYGLTELIDDDDQPVTELGREGRIVGTGFLSTGMPFIRYDTRDFAKLVQLPSSENGYRLRVSGIAPRRKPDFLITIDGSRLVATALVPEHPEFFTGISEYQFRQDVLGKVVLQYVRVETGTSADAERMCRELSGMTKGGISFEPQEVTQIATGRGGKRAFIDQRLELDLY
jgi:phenylacetate-CoA ligase